MSIGNGGAGPLEGVFSLQSALERFNPNVECILEDCLSQDMKALSKYEDDLYEGNFYKLRSCVLPITMVLSMLKMLIELKNQGKTIILSSHHMEDIKELSDEIYVMDNGQLSKYDK